MSEHVTSKEMMQRHWTERSPEDFAHCVARDFDSQFEAPETEDPRTLIEMVIEARARGRKVAVVVYDDGDSLNCNGPVSGGIFAECWKKLGEPKDYFDLEEAKRRE